VPDVARRLTPLLLSLTAFVACSGKDKQHAPYSNNDCLVPPCGVQPAPGGSGTPLGEGGSILFPDSAIGTQGEFGGCAKDPLSGEVLCTEAAACATGVIDPAMAGCGYLQDPGQLDVFCVCPNSQTLCPLMTGNASSCTALTTKLLTASPADPCQSNIASCRPWPILVGSGGSSGAGGSP
jgi:hypothetical protein